MMYLNGCRGTGEGDKSASSLILYSWAGGLQQVVDATDKTGTLGRVSMANLKDSKNSDVISVLVACLDALKPESD